MCTRCGRTWVTAGVEAAVERGAVRGRKGGRGEKRIWIARGASWSVLHNRGSDLPITHAALGECRTVEDTHRGCGE